MEGDLLTDCCSVWLLNCGAFPVVRCLKLVELLQVYSMN